MNYETTGPIDSRLLNNNEKTCKHKFQPRYNIEEYSENIVDPETCRQLNRVFIESHTIKTYIYDICPKCGEIRKSEKEVNK